MGHKHKIDYRYKTYKMSSPRLLAQRQATEGPAETRGPIEVVPSRPISRPDRDKFERLKDNMHAFSAWKTTTVVSQASGKANATRSSSYKNSQQKSNRQTPRSASGPRYKITRPLILQSTKISRSADRGKTEHVSVSQNEKKEVQPVVKKEKVTDRSPSPLHNLLFPQHPAKGPQFSVTPVRMSLLSGFSSMCAPFKKNFENISPFNSQSPLDFCPRCLSPSLNFAYNIGLPSQPELLPKDENHTGNKSSLPKHEPDLLGDSVSCQAPSECDVCESKAVQVNSFSSQEQFPDVTKIVPGNEKQSRPHSVITKQKSNSIVRQSLQNGDHGMAMNDSKHGFSRTQEECPNRDTAEEQVTRRCASQGQRPHQRSLASGTSTKESYSGSKNSTRCSGRSQIIHYHSSSPTRRQSLKRSAAENGRPHRSPSLQHIHNSDPSSDDSLKNCLKIKQASRRMIASADNIKEQNDELSEAGLSLWKSLVSIFFTVFKPILGTDVIAMQNAGYPVGQKADFPGSSVDATFEMHFTDTKSSKNSLAYAVHPVHNHKDFTNKSSKCRPFNLNSFIRESSTSKAAGCTRHKSVPAAYAENRGKGVGNDSITHTFAMMDECMGDIGYGGLYALPSHSRNNMDEKQPSNVKNKDSRRPLVCESLSEEIFSNAPRIPPFIYTIGSKMVMTGQYPGKRSQRFHDYPEGHSVSNADKKILSQRKIPLTKIIADKLACSESYTEGSIESVPSQTQIHDYIQGHSVRRMLHKGKFHSGQMLDLSRLSPSPPRSRKLGTKRGSPLSQGRSRLDAFATERKKAHPSKRGYHRLFSNPSKDFSTETSDNDDSRQDAEREAKDGAVTVARRGKNRHGSSSKYKSAGQHWRH